MIFLLVFFLNIFLILLKIKFKACKERQQNDRKSFLRKTRFRGIKEINILGRQKEFSNQYLIKYANLAKLFFYKILLISCHVWLEIFVFMSLLVFYSFPIIKMMKYQTIPLLFVCWYHLDFAKYK